MQTISLPPVAQTQSQRREKKKETVTLLSTVSKKGNANVKTISELEIICKNIRQVYPQLKVNDTISADVIYEGDQAVEATWRAN